MPKYERDGSYDLKAMRLDVVYGVPLLECTKIHGMAINKSADKNDLKCDGKTARFYRNH